LKNTTNSSLVPSGKKAAPKPAPVPAIKDGVVHAEASQGVDYSVQTPKDVSVQTTSYGQGTSAGIIIIQKDKNLLSLQAILNEGFYTGDGSADYTYAWGLFKSSGLKAIAEASRQTSIKANKANPHIKNKNVGELFQVKLADGEAWAYQVDEAYSSGFKDDLQSGSTVPAPSYVVFATNNKHTIILSGNFDKSDELVLQILNTLKLN